MIQSLDIDAILELPKIQEVDRTPKLQYAKSPNIDLLQPDQRVIFDEVMDTVNRKGSSIYLIKGYAGTGKTFLVSMLTEQILSSTGLKVAVTAPTNKAVKVLKAQSKFSEDVLNLRFSTIHSLMGLRQKITGYGKQIFVKMRDEDVKVGDYHVIILDEVSMFPDDLHEQLMPYLKLYNIKLIFVGDPAQIPPVGKTDCIPFTEKGVKEHNIKVGNLTKVLRQSLENPIIKMTMKIRSAIHRADVIPVRNSEFDPNTYDGVYFLDGGDKVFFERLLHTYFTSPNFAIDADFAKIIAWTNKTVSIFNRKIRGMIYGQSVGKICVGEKLIANKPIVSQTDETSVLYSNNDEFEVISFEVVDGNYDGAELKYYETQVQSRGSDEKTIRIIHEDSDDDYKLILNHLADLAKAEVRGSWKAASAWQTFYKVQEVFADVSYNYAITAHKSQGSTYVNTIVMEEDMDKNRKIEERNRIKYTAFTRPSKQLFVIR